MVAKPQNDVHDHTAFLFMGCYGLVPICFLIYIHLNFMQMHSQTWEEAFWAICKFGTQHWFINFIPNRDIRVKLILPGVSSPFLFQPFTLLKKSFLAVREFSRMVPPTQGALWIPPTFMLHCFLIQKAHNLHGYPCRNENEMASHTPVRKWTLEHSPHSLLLFYDPDIHLLLQKKCFGKG